MIVATNTFLSFLTKKSVVSSLSPISNIIRILTLNSNQLSMLKICTLLWLYGFYFSTIILTKILCLNLSINQTQDLRILTKNCKILWLCLTFIINWKLIMFVSFRRGEAHFYIMPNCQILQSKYKHQNKLHMNKYNPDSKLPVYGCLIIPNVFK